MDTRFWGPPAWVMLHTIAQGFNKDNESAFKTFYSNLRNVLPCIYCRNSFSEFLEKCPIRTGSRREFNKWLYAIHNLVNDKLRKQGLVQWNNPSFADVDARYRAMYSAVYDHLNTCKSKSAPHATDDIMGWNFLYCLAFNYPERDPTVTQIHGYTVFFRLLGRILPKGYAEVYQSYIQNNPIQLHVGCRDDMKRWIYQLEHTMDDNFSVRCKEFHEIEKEIEMYRSGCGNAAKGANKDKMPTCRMKSANTISKIIQPLRLRHSSKRLRHSSKRLRHSSKRLRRVHRL